MRVQSRWVSGAIGVFLRTYWRIRPLVFSFVPRYQALYGSVK